MSYYDPYGTAQSSSSAYALEKSMALAEIGEATEVTLARAEAIAGYTADLDERLLALARAERELTDLRGVKVMAKMQRDAVNAWLSKAGKSRSRRVRRSARELRESLPMLISGFGSP